MTISLGNRAKMSTSTTGTGTITLGSAVSGFQTFADAGITNGQTVRYAIDDGANFEIGSGTYTSSGTTLTRSVTESSNSDSAITLSGNAEVFIAATVADLNPLYAANPSSATSPTASGTNAVAIGDNAVASGFASISIGKDSDSTNTNSIALGRLSQATGANGSIAIGLYADSSGDGSVAIGSRDENNTAIATGETSVALGTARATGADSLAGVITNNTSSYGATSGGAIALGQNAKASYFRATAIGEYAIASGNRATAIGRSATSAGTYAFAGGGQSRADGDYSVALGQSFANGENSFAAGIGVTNGSKGAMNINSVAIGQNANAGYNNSLAIGISATTGAANQIALGGTSNQVKISGTYTLPTADGSANQVLTTNGSGAVSFADAGGGGFDSDLTIDGKTANYTIVAGDAGKIISHSSNDVTFTFTAAATLGAGWHCWVKNRAGATNVTTFDFNGSENLDGIGNGKLFTGESIHVYCDGSNFHSVDRTIMWAGNTATDYYAQPQASGGGSIAAGLQAVSGGDDSIAIGFSSTANSSYSTAIGYGSYASGTRAMALGWSRTGGTDSLSAQIGTNSSSYGASGANSVAIGTSAKSTASYSLAIGENSIASANRAVSLGRSNTAGGIEAVAIGSNNTATGTGGYIAYAFGNTNTATGIGSVALGTEAKATIKTQIAMAAGKFAAVGDAQGSTFILRSDTTDATAEAMTTNNSTAAADNQIVAASDTCITFHGTITAMQNGAQAHAGWEIKGMLVNDGGTTTLALGNVSDMAATNASSWAVALSADNTNNALKIQVTGEAGHNIRWVANVQTAEVTYA